MYLQKKIILSSQSRIRKRILENAGLTFSTVKPETSEEILKETLKEKRLPAEEIIKELARSKSLSSSQNAYSIGCDQGVIFQDQLYDKVSSLEEARQRLKILRGKSHKLYGITFVSFAGKPLWFHEAISILKMHNFSDRFLEKYLEQEGERVLESVGCYRLEGRGIQLFENIEGNYFDILGLSLLPLLAFFRRVGIFNEENGLKI